MRRRFRIFRSFRRFHRLGRLCVFGSSDRLGRFVMRWLGGRLRAVGPVMPWVTFRAFMTLRRFVAFGPAAPRLKLAQGAQQRLDLAFVRELLAFGMLDQFQNFFHLLQCLFQRFDDLHHFVDGLADGGTIGPRHTRRMSDRIKPVARRLRVRGSFRCADG